jgi:hypothetical protein
MVEFAKFELTGVKEALDTFSSKKVRQAIRSTLDKTGTFAKREIVTEVSSKYNIPAKDVRSHVDVIRTRIDDLETILHLKSLKYSLIYFNARQAPKGVLVNIRSGKLTFYAHAFIQTMKTGHRDVFIRKIQPWPPGVGRGKKGKGKGVDPQRKEKLKMKGLPGPSIPNMAKEAIDKIRVKVIAFMQETFAAEIKKRIGY